MLANGNRDIGILLSELHDFIVRKRAPCPSGARPLQKITKAIFLER